VSDRNVALDIMQDVFMRYWDSLLRKSDISNDKAFLFTIARNAIIDWYRKKKAISLESLKNEADEGEEFTLIEDNSKGAIELGAEARFLLDKIRSLPHTSQQILYLRYVEDLKPSDIAQILNIKENAVSVRIFRGLADLRKITGYELTE
jgi:RNA polymerase sigma-70 factor (ECF subfamily)